MTGPPVDLDSLFASGAGVPRGREPDAEPVDLDSLFDAGERAESTSVLGKLGGFLRGILPAPGEGGFAAAKGADNLGAFQPFERSRPRMKLGERPINISESLPVAGSAQVDEAARSGLPFAPTRLAQVTVEGKGAGSLETLANMANPAKAKQLDTLLRDATVEEQERRVAATNAPALPKLQDYSESHLRELADQLDELRADRSRSDPVTADRLRVYSHNLRLIAENRAKYDRFAPIAASNALALVGDPYASLKREVNLVEREGGVPSPAEQSALGITPTPIDRPFELQRDLVAAAVGQVPAMLVGGALARAGTGALETAAAGTRLAGTAGKLARLAEPIETPAGAGLRARSVARLARGATEGQVIGAGIEAAKALQSGSDNPLDSGLTSLGLGALVGAPLEVAGGAAADVLRAGIARLGARYDAHLARLYAEALQNPGVRHAVATDPARQGQLEELANVLGDLMRAREGSAGEPNATAAAEPLLAPNRTVRFHHGGAIYETGPRWLTPDRAYAEGYAQKSGGVLQYVDVPADSPHLVKAFDDTGTSAQAPFLSFEAPADIAKGLKPIEPAAPATPEPVPPQRTASRPVAGPTAADEGHATLFHETSPERAVSLATAFEDKRGLYVSPNPDLALGQSGKGAVVEFANTHDIGVERVQKPGAALSEAMSGVAPEYRITAAPQAGDRVARSITFAADATPRPYVMRRLQTLGWTREALPDGRVRFSNPAIPSPEALDRIPAELRESIEKQAPPLLAVAAAASAPPSNANGEDGRRQPGSLYGSLIGGAVMGAALAYLATNGKARRLVSENRELRRELMRDALTGLANKRALERAIPSIDGNEEWRWIVLDGDQFKKVNDALGHTKGDEALKHFGKSIMDAAEEHGVPMRGFRNGKEDTDLAFRGGGDEFSFAVPADKAAAVLDAIQRRSELDFGDGIKTRLTGSIGDTWEAADAAANAVKEARRVANPELRRQVESVASREGVTVYSSPIWPALKELRRHPSAAGLAVLGAVLSESDDPQIQQTGAPIIALAALHAIGGKALASGKDALGAGVVDMLSRTTAGKTLVRAFNPDALLSPEVRLAVREYEATVAKGRARAREFGTMAEQLGPSGDRAVSDVIEGESFEDTSAMSASDIEAVLTVAAEITREMDALGEAKVRTGVLTAAQRDKYAGHYLPRRYAEWDALDALGERRPLNSDRKTRIGAGRSRRRVPLEGRNELGEIREASYRASSGIEKGYGDVAAAELFHTLRATPGVIHPEFQSALDDFLAAKELVRAATSDADADAAVAMMDEAKLTMDMITRQFETTAGKGEYVPLPDSPGLGVLRGMVVQRDVANSINGIPDAKATGRLLRWWKEAHTVFNPGTHLGNVAGNVSLAHLAGMTIPEQPYWLMKAARDLKTYGEGTRALAEAGILDVNAVTADGLANTTRSRSPAKRLESLAVTTRPETRSVLLDRGVRDVSNPGPLRRMGGAVVAGADAVRNVYNNEDNVFRVAMYLKARAKRGGFRTPLGGMGKSAEEAVQLARDSFGDFRTRSPAIHFLRSSGLAPFIIWPAKVLPRVARNIVDHPWRYLTLVASWAALDQYSKHKVGRIQERDISPRDRSRLGYFLPGFTQLPFTGSRGERAAFDISRFTPLSALTTAAPPGTAAATLDEDFPALLTPSGPFTDLAAKVVLNRDPFTGDEILKTDYPTSENVGRLARAVVNEALPPALGFHRERLQEDIANRDPAKLRTDLLGPLGLRPRFVQPGSGALYAQLDLQNSLREMKQDLARSLRRSKSPERNQELVEQYARRVRQAVANYRERVGADAPVTTAGESGTAGSVDLDALFGSQGPR